MDMETAHIIRTMIDNAVLALDNHISIAENSTTGEVTQGFIAKSICGNITLDFSIHIEAE